MYATEEEVAHISDIIDEPSELNEASIIFERLFSGQLCVDDDCSKKSIEICIKAERMGNSTCIP